ncbi:hypothetical protein AX14_013018 [Amanita brunnescens Koide BX004]|nr:hypothetical protein AX14_013018 [Amanita brunnescens Koide BX004]
MKYEDSTSKSTQRSRSFQNWRVNYEDNTSKSARRSRGFQKLVAVSMNVLRKFIKSERCDVVFEESKLAIVGPRGFAESKATGTGSLNAMLPKPPRMAECGKHPPLCTQRSHRRLHWTAGLGRMA